MIGALAACAASTVLLAIGIDAGTRPRLGPDDVSEQLTRELIMTTRFAWPPAGSGGPEIDDPAPYDVDRALRSDETTRGDDLEPEGLGPARRRYVREPADQAVLRGTVTLVKDVSGISERRRRQYPF